MGQLQLLHTGADPAPLSVAAALDTWKWYSTAFPILVICWYLRCWNSCTARTPATDFFFFWLKHESTPRKLNPQHWLSFSSWDTVFQLYLFLTMRVSGYTEMWEKIVFTVALDPYRRAVYNFPLSPLFSYPCLKTNLNLGRFLNQISGLKCLVRKIHIWRWMRQSGPFLIKSWLFNYYDYFIFLLTF